MTKFPKLAWLDAVRKCSKIPAGQRLVIEHIGGTADQAGNDAWKANARVMAELGVSLDTVKRARKAAVTEKLWVVSSPAPKGAGNTHTTEYRLVMPTPVNECTTAPISEEIDAVETQIGANDAVNGGKSTPEIGAAEVPPLVTSSDSSLGSSSVAHGLEAGTDTELEQIKTDDSNEDTVPEWITEEADDDQTVDCWKCEKYRDRCEDHGSSARRSAPADKSTGHSRKRAYNRSKTCKLCVEYKSNCKAHGSDYMKNIFSDWWDKAAVEVNVTAVENLLGTRYVRPDLPDDVRGVENCRAFHVGHAREWIREKADEHVAPAQT